MIRGATDRARGFAPGDSTVEGVGRVTMTVGVAGGIQAVDPGHGEGSPAASGTVRGVLERENGNPTARVAPRTVRAWR
jgi:hypothetical protein